MPLFLDGCISENSLMSSLPYSPNSVQHPNINEPACIRTSCVLKRKFSDDLHNEISSSISRITGNQSLPSYHSEEGTEDEIEFLKCHTSHDYSNYEST